ncbi:MULTISPECIES: hypothetical protein [unclassified Streptomyces]|uniref:hypothetical protein n=1 Tax=unclassified Streptomyces TaxID=2593676 RepID=UPI001BE54104|nr:MULTISPECIES: hypothetical protein [unclassified Streptomyces]MBT2402171.1 hypothetical protein [Streptomyces sp. ISL-21]MBT2609357.1 hypothetical protein [Streptomyces sp. ISL-87]
MSETLLSHAVGAVKQARRTAGLIRRRVERINTVPALGSPGRARTTLRPVHLSVLGGRTFNLAVPSPRRAGELAGALLVFERRDQRQAVPMELEPQPNGTVLLTVTAPLRHARYDAKDASGPRLTDGVWRLAIEATDAKGRKARFALTAPPAHVGDGPTLSSPPSDSSGATFRPMRSVDGQSMIKVTPPRTGAELTGFDLRWDRISVHGRLIAAGSPADFTAEAVRGSAVVSIRPQFDGDRFAFDVPLDAMAARGRGKGVWDIQMRSGRNRIRIGRRLTDVRHPKKVFRTPFRTIATEGGALLRVHAHLSAAGNLTVSSTVISTKEIA